METDIPLKALTAACARDLLFRLHGAVLQAPDEASAELALREAATPR